jgi:hypothetical protein
VSQQFQGFQQALDALRRVRDAVSRLVIQEAFDVVDDLGGQDQPRHGDAG